MKFKIIDCDNIPEVEFPLSFIAPTNKAYACKSYIYHGNNVEIIDSNNYYINVPFVDDNISEEQIDKNYKILIDIALSYNNKIREEGCVHIRKTDEHGDVWHGFAILDAIETK